MSILLNATPFSVSFEQVSKMFADSLDAFAANLKRSLRNDNNALVNIHNAPATSASTVDASKNEGFAFCFDVDGVFLHSSNVLPGAVDVLGHLENNSIPYLFMTNSGGHTEESRIAQFSSRFGLPLNVNLLVQSHTPFQALVPEYKDKTVLVIGGVGNGARNVALHYGFRNVVTTADIAVAHSDIWPFNESNKQYYADIAEGHPLPKPINPEDPANSLQIAAILVISSSRDWGFDAQIVLDLLLADNGVLGTTSPLNGNPSLPNHGYQQQKDSCKIFFSNPDFEWVTSYKHGLRYGQGAWIKCLEALYREHTHHTAFLQSTTIGKPTRESYVYAEDRLINNRKVKTGADEAIPFARVTMIGDNPASDIAGAMAFRSPHGTTWDAVLLESGVHIAGTVPRHTPTVIVPRVKDAVNFVLQREGLPQIP